jgi:hypothetical protein
MEKLLQTHLFTENDIYAGVDANGVGGKICNLQE